MPMPWEKKFWTGKKGGLDVWDIASLGGNELSSQIFGGDNPLEQMQNFGSGVKGLWGDVTGKTAADAAKDAARTQAEYGQKALDLQKGIYEQSREDALPWMEAGKRGLGTLEEMMGGGEFEMGREEFDPGQFSFTMEDYQQSPYAKFLQQEGQRGIERSAAARGGLASGKTLAGLQQRAMDISGRDYADQYGRKRQAFESDRAMGYQNFLDSYRRRAGEKSGKYNRLANLAGIGQTQSGLLGQMGGQYAGQAGAGLTGIGNVMGAGRMGAANARQAGLQNLLNLGGQFGAAAIMSDRRLKRDIKRVGTWKGHNTYRFKYHNSPQEYLGVMADEVKRVKPHAVKEVGGYLAVNYGAL